MPAIRVADYELSYSFNGAQSRTDGLTLVLVHGAGGQELDWPIAWRSLDDITRKMGLTPKSHSGDLDNYPIYAVDLPGHGQSGGNSQRSVDAYADSIAGFLEALDLTNVLLVGHSMGAGIALTLSIRKNERLAGIALIGGSSRLAVSDAILTGLQSAFEATVDNIVKYSWNRDTGDFFKQKARQQMLEAGSDVVHDDFYACSQFDLSAELSAVTMPTLVIASDNDRMVPLETSRTMAQAIANSKFITLQDCGHFQHVEQTAAVAAAMSDFLKNELVR